LGKLLVFFIPESLREATQEMKNPLTDAMETPPQQHTTSPDTAFID